METTDFKSQNWNFVVKIKQILKLWSIFKTLLSGDNVSSSNIPHDVTDMGITLNKYEIFHKEPADFPVKIIQ